MKTVCEAGVKKELLDRIEKLTNSKKGFWGKMNVHKMVCHLTDQLRDLDGSRPVKYEGNLITRHALRHILSRFENWPKGVFPSASDYDQLKNGTKPIDFSMDKQTLIRMLEKLDLSDEKKKLPIHPAFGELTHKQYARIVYLHFNHHLKQFGV
jgi:hypothetical protein